MKSLFRLVLGDFVLIALAVGGVYVAAQQRPSVAQGLKSVQSSTTAAKSLDSKVDTMNKAADQAK